MKGKEIINALNNGQRVNVRTSTGRILYANSVAPEGGIDGQNFYGDDRTMGIGMEDEYDAVAWDYPGDDSPEEENNNRIRRDRPTTNRVSARPQRPPRR